MPHAAVESHLMAVLVVLAGLAALLLLGRRALRVWRLQRLTRTMPGPPSYPIIGSFLEIAGQHEGMQRRFERIMKAYGPVFKFWMGPIFAVVVLDPDDLEVVLTSPHVSDKAGLVYRALRPIIGQGLITMNGVDYKRHRKAITTSLHLDILQDFVHIFSENAARLSRRLRPLADSGEVFNVTPLLGQCAGLSVCETVLSTDVTDMEQERDAFVAVAHTSSRLMLFRALRPWYNLSDALFSLSDRYHEYQRMARGMTSFVSKVLDRRIQQFKAGEKPPNRRLTFLDSILRSEEGCLRREELFDELKTLMFAASSTSMDFLSFFFVCVSLLPDAQARIHEELDEVFGSDRDRRVQPEDLPHLQYLERVLKEVLRLYPPVPALAREAKQDVRLPSGHVVPAGTIVGIFPSMTHRDKRHFPSPLKFDPDRFLPENSRGRHPFAFIPFSAGSRNCIGQRYAFMFAKTVAATVLRDYAVLPDPKGPRDPLRIRIVGGISMSVRGGANVRVQRRPVEVRGA